MYLDSIKDKLENDLKEIINIVNKNQFYYFFKNYDYYQEMRIQYEEYRNYVELPIQTYVNKKVNGCNFYYLNEYEQYTHLLVFVMNINLRTVQQIYQSNEFEKCFVYKTDEELFKKKNELTLYLCGNYFNQIKKIDFYINN